jgi:zinc transport system permease protein
MTIELLTMPFVLRACIASAIVGGVCGTLGVFVVLRRLSFVGDGIAHAAFAGIAIGFALGISPLLSAFIFCALVALSIAFVSRRGIVAEDTGIGIFFSASMALGILLFSKSGVQFGDVVSILFGSVLQITDHELLIGGAILILVLGIVTVFHKEFMTLVFDEEVAFMSGLPVTLFVCGLFLLIAGTVVSTVRLVGTVLIASLLITPAATVLLFAKSFRGALIMSGLYGMLVAEAGLFLSLWLDTPPGALIALLSTAIFLAALLFTSGERYKPLK